MSTLSLPINAATLARDVFILFSKKAAFEIVEYADAGNVYKRLAAAVEGAEGASSVEVGENDIKYVLSAIEVCSKRTPIESQNWKPISDLEEDLKAAIRAEQAEQAEEKASVTEL